jgi:hypothetical protein
VRPFGDDFPNPNHDSSEGEQGSVVIIYPGTGDSQKTSGKLRAILNL